MKEPRVSSSVLLESDLDGILLEALSAHIQAVFPDNTVVVGAHPAFPAARTVLAGVRVPDVVVTHIERLEARG